MTIGSNYIPSLVTVTTSETELVPFNRNREALVLFNMGSQDAQIYFESASTMYYVLEAGKGMHFPNVPYNQVQAKTASGSTDITVMEG